MSSFTEDLFTTVLVRLPLKSITTFKLVCKQWKSIVESTFFIELFMSHNQNSHSSWSLMCEDSPEEVMAYYGCKIWGLPRTLGSYISSFITNRFKNQAVKVEAYSDVGLILISSESFHVNLSYYVANPISRQGVKIPSPPLPPPSPSCSIWCRELEPSGLATKIENNLSVRYKVVMMQRYNIEPFVRKILLYSSETRLWSSIILQMPLPLHRVEWFYPVSLNGTLYCVGYSFDNEEVVVSHDLFGEPDRCKVLLFPDVGKDLKFKRVFKASQGFLTYMNIVHETKDDRSLEDKLCVWKLKSGEWQVVFEISLDFTIPSFKYFLLAINPFDANKLYLWSEMHKCLTSTNLHKEIFGLDNNLEHCSDDRILNFAGQSEPIERNHYLEYSTFVLPHWLYRIPNARTKVTEQRTQDQRRRSTRARVPNRKYAT